jgi:hypothetical protein
MNAAVTPWLIRRAAVASVLAVVVGLMAAAPSASADEKGARVVVLDDAAEQTGLTYGQWSSRWWQYVLSIPVHDSRHTDKILNPLFDETGSQCGFRQSGPVFFLVGVINTSGEAERTCTVPDGKFLFFPILNNECSSMERAPFHGTTRAELAMCNNGFVSLTTNLVAQIDGQAVRNLSKFRVCRPKDPLCTAVPLIDVTLPADNALGPLDPQGVLTPPGLLSLKGTSLGDGFYLMLEPLSRGQHLVHFGGSLPGFTLDIIYHLTVKD